MARRPTHAGFCFGHICLPGNKLNSVSRLGQYLLVEYSRFRRMTAQALERITYLGKRYSLRSLPLDSYFSDAHPKPDFGAITLSFCSACWRGYVGSWEIDGDQLLLIDILLPFSESEQSLLHLVSAQKPPIVANWYTGELRLQKGEPLRYDFDWSAIYEEEIVFNVERGVIVSSHIVDHRLEPPSPV